MNPFRDAKSLGHILSHMETLPPGSWLYLPEDVMEVSTGTLCLPISLDEESPEKVEWFVKENGLKQFLLAWNLEDVLENLRLQHSAFTESELMAAVNFYWKNDAFIGGAN